MKKDFAFVLLLGIILLFKVEASLISFQIVETGLPDNAGINRHSVIWENAFMEVFFDSGYIVSNYPMMRFDSNPQGHIQDIARFDVFDARDASVDYILIARLDFSSPINGPELISLYVFKVDNHEIIYERKHNGSVNRSERDMNDEIKRLIRDLVRFVTNL